MGNVDSLPIVSQVKSGVQAVARDTAGARRTQMNFLRGCPIVSQGYAAVVAIQGNTNEAQESQKYFLRNMSTLADGFPVLGHVKGAIHYACGDREGGDSAMKAASRTTAVMAGGVGGMIIGGPIGAVAGGVAGGVAMDGIITGADSAVKGEYSPYGHIQMATAAVNGELDVGQGFDWIMMPLFDGISGFASGKLFRSIQKHVVANRNFRAAVKQAVINGDITLQEGETVSALADQLKAAAKELKSTYESSNLPPGQRGVSSIVIDIDGGQHTGYNFKLREAMQVDAFDGNVPTAAQIIEQRLPGREISIRGMKMGEAQCAEIHALHKHHNTNGLTSNPSRTITVGYDGTNCQALSRCANCSKVGKYVNMGQVVTDALDKAYIPFDDAAINSSIQLLAPCDCCEDEEGAHKHHKRH